MIKVVQEIDIREIAGKELAIGDRRALTVGSHKTRAALVVLTCEGAQVTVSARELRAAIDNATNTAG